VSAFVTTSEVRHISGHLHAAASCCLAVAIPMLNPKLLRSGTMRLPRWALRTVYM
jgi:hypothetical protein